ncbi:MAG: DUF805 domain-containing protein [Aeromicrobium sp.]|uniref:DUF805 domain-containing protein n=1 Tax=Aeromicrobium sp. TaxID=1871063 RepID=UPI00261FA4DA|nr:DUF805 domain-containing protein [Aeromicrobium sp.]MDF1703989.1 DUF805 domain-containing protein [Aeromicrobium sp.]
MNLQQAVSSVLSQYATFTGRARRSEYWFWVLATVIVSFVGAIIDGIIGIQIVQTLLLLATIVPNLAVGARRLHDTGRSGWLQLIGLIPIVGWIILIVWFAQDSHPDNEHGPNPKGRAAGPYGHPTSPAV